MKEELSKKLDDTISGISKGEESKDNTSEGGGAKETTPGGKDGFTCVRFDYAQLNKGPNMHFPTVNPAKPPHFDGTRFIDWALLIFV